MKHNIAFSVAVLAVCSMFLFIVFGNNGLADLKMMRNGKDSLVRRNETLQKQNLVFSQTIHRLKNDAEYIESIARKEMGVIGRHEIIFKLVNVEPEGMEQ